MEKYGVDTSQPEGEKTASAGCEKADCPHALDKSKNPPKCAKCGYEYLSRRPANG